MLDRAFTQPPVRAALNAFPVQGGGHTVLIDTGAATGLGASWGRLPAALAAGPMLERFGWAELNAAILPLLALAAVMTAVWAREKSAVRPLEAA